MNDELFFITLIHLKVRWKVLLSFQNGSNGENIYLENHAYYHILRYVWAETILNNARFEAVGGWSEPIPNAIRFEGVGGLKQY